MALKNYQAKLLRHRKIAHLTYELVLEETGIIRGKGEDKGPFGVPSPGQFVNLVVPDFYLRRPFSVADYSDGKLVLIYKILGQGTRAMADRLEEGQTLSVLSPLGNGFTLVDAEKPLLIGGGVGLPPMYYLAKALKAKGQEPRIAMGFKTADEVFYEEAFRDLGLEVQVATEDGSKGTGGFVTQILEGSYKDGDYLYCCGPMPMLEAIYKMDLAPGQYSFEERMGCGMGACMGCSHKVKNYPLGSKRICKEGPVFRTEEILW